MDLSAEQGTRKPGFQIPHLPQVHFFLHCTSPSLPCAPLHSFQITSLSHYLHLYFCRSNRRGPASIISCQHQVHENCHVL